MANIGTTMKGAIDDVCRVRDIIGDLAATTSCLHADAALGGMVLSFADRPEPYGFDVGSDSVSISDRKMIGSPLPGGVALTRREYALCVARSLERVGVFDTPLTGSRNALTLLTMWDAFEQRELDGFRHVVNRCLETEEYAVTRLNDGGIPAWRNRISVTVVFPRPSADVLRKWQLVPHGDIAHLIAMPHVTCETIDAVVEDCLE